jgi:hypothetical protein
LLRPEFVEQRVTHAFEVTRASRLLVTMGGSDPMHATELVIRSLKRLTRRFDVTILVGGANGRLDSIREQCADVGGVRVVYNATDTASLMATADLAVAAVGGTMWELACMGVPSLLLSATDVHHRIGQYADRFGAFKWLGTMESVRESDLADAVAALADDAELRKRMRRRARLLVDGQGARRVADALCGESVGWRVRRATAADIEAIWELQGYGAVDEDPGGQCTWVLETCDSVAGAVTYTEDADGIHASVRMAAAFSGSELATRLLRESTPVPLR